MREIKRDLLRKGTEHAGEQEQTYGNVRFVQMLRCKTITLVPEVFLDV